MLLGSACFQVQAEENVTLKVVLLVTSAEQRAAWLKVTTQFKKIHPNIRIEARHLDNKRYHDFMANWHKRDVDILYSFAGERLFEYAQKDLIHPLNDLWLEENWHSTFPQFTSSVTLNEQLYAVPISYYQWGFYFNRELFQSLAIMPPNTWQDLLAVCEKIKASGQYPLLMGLRENWPAASWFSFLNLRLNGRKYHLELLAGEHSFDDPKIDAVFQHWKTLIDAEYFHPRGLKATDKQMLIYLYKEEAAMTLNGNFITKHLKPEYRNDYDFFGFPQIDASIDRVEEAPTDVLFISASSEHKKHAKLFLRFMQTADTLSLYNDTVGYISPHKDSRDSNNYFVQKGADWVKSANNTTMFFDRDSKQQFAKKAFPILANFMRNPDIKLVKEQLEKARKKTLIRDAE